MLALLVGGLGGVLIGRYWPAEGSTGTPAEAPRPRSDALQRDRSPRGDGAGRRLGLAILLASVVILVAEPRRPIAQCAGIIV